MRFTSRFSVVALCALAWAGSAAAETPSQTITLEPGAFAVVTEMRLDDAFEKSAAEGAHDVLERLAGPTSMDCTNAVTRSELETCVVTVAGTPRASTPASLAQH